MYTGRVPRKIYYIIYTLPFPIITLTGMSCVFRPNPWYHLWSYPGHPIVFSQIYIYVENCYLSWYINTYHSTEWLFRLSIEKPSCFIVVYPPEWCWFSIPKKPTKNQHCKLSNRFSIYDKLSNKIWRPFYLISGTILRWK